MDCLLTSKWPLLICSLLIIVGCSNTSNDTPAEPDTRPTMSEFTATLAEPHDLAFSSQETVNSILAANRAMISAFQNAISDHPEVNVTMSPWPMFSTLALATAASHGDTASEINYDIAAFGLERSWSLAYRALLKSQETTLSEGVTKVKLDIWSQFDSQFETDFLQQIHSTFQASYHIANFKSAENIDAVVDHLAIGTFGDHFSLELNQYANTRLLMLSQNRIVGAFTNNALNIERIDGLFENDNNELIRTPMIRIQGNLDYYENNELTAYRIPVESNQFSLISIQPKEDMDNFITDHLETILASLSEGWVNQDTLAILPVLNTHYSLSGSWLSDLINTSSLYSEEFADLRNMDHKGGLYMQGLNWENRLAISEQGIDLAAISGQAVTFSELNIFWPTPGGFHSGSWKLTPGPDYPFCTEIPPEPDLSTGLLIIQNTNTGLIQSVLQLKTLEGSKEGQTDCILLD